MCGFAEVRYIYIRIYLYNSGQSNMQFTVHQAFNGIEEIQEAGNYPNIRYQYIIVIKRPICRVFTVGQGNYSYKPLDELAAIEQKWSISSSSSIGGGDWTYMSAVCWWFGKDLYEKYGIPIGLISNNWGNVHFFSQLNAISHKI
jgi:sialate O-acetylesterase